LIVRKRSKVDNWGVFATQSINKNKRIIEYLGEKVKTKEADRRSDQQTAKGTLWIFEINRAWSRDAAVGGGISPVL